jgi:hypothetical protein
VVTARGASGGAANHLIQIVGDRDEDHQPSPTFGFRTRAPAPM